MPRSEQTGLDTMMSSSEVATRIADGEYEEPRQNRGVIISTDPNEGARQAPPPYLSILQGQSEAVNQKKGAAGQFYIRNFPALDAVTLVPLGLGNFREYRPNKEMRNAPVLCSSPDGVVGHGDPGGPCAQCPLSEWGPKNPATGRSTRPPCTEGVMMAAFLCEYGQPVLLPLRGRSIRIADDIRAQARFRGFGSFAIKATTELQKYDVGSAHTPAIEFLLEVPEGSRGFVAQALGQMNGGSSAEPQGDVIDVSVS